MKNFTNFKFYLGSILIFLICFSLYLNVYKLDELNNDRFSFWATSRAYSKSINPYDPVAVQSETKEANHYLEREHIELVWSPPIVFSFTQIYSKFSFSNFRLYLLVVCILNFIITQIIIFRLLGPGRRKFLLAPYFWTNVPLFFTPIGGPIVSYSLFGLAVYFYLQSTNYSGNSTRAIASGCFLSITLIKPHLVSILFLHVLITSLKSKNWDTIIGIFIGVAILSLSSLLQFPEVWQLWLGNLLKPASEHLTPAPLLYLTPTLSSWFINYFSLPINLKFVLTMFAAVTYAVWFITYSNKYSMSDHRLIAIALSIVAAPYLWVYDFIMLSIPASFAIYYLLTRLKSRLQTAIYLMSLLFLGSLFFSSLNYMHQMVWYSSLVGIGSISAILTLRKIT